MFAKIYAFFAPIVNRLDNFLDQASNWINAVSLIVAVVTLITMLRFKHRIKVEFEKENFQKKRTRILKDLDGFSSSLLEDSGVYVSAFLEKIDVYLLELITSYTFLNPWLTVQLRYTSLCINHRYMKEVASGNCKSRHKLCRQLRGILVLMRKE